MRNVLSMTMVLLLWSLAGIAVAQEQSYTVRLGDTIVRIAAQFNVEVDAILVRNNLLDPNRIRIGQTLIIPTGKVTVLRTHVVGSGETLTDIAARYNTTVDALLVANDLPTWWVLVVGQVLTLPPAGGAAPLPRAYTLATGDTLRNVGERFGVTWQTLAAYNNIANANDALAGMTIAIPPAGWTPPAAPPAPAPVVPPAPTAAAPQPMMYVVQHGDVIELLATRFGVTVEALAASNRMTDTRAILPGDVLVIPPVGGPVTVPPVAISRETVDGRYTVRAGDTLYSIAASFGVNLYHLAEANRLFNLTRIYPGQSLVIPGR